MKKILLTLLFLITSCSNANDCPELIFDPLAKLTSTNDGTLYTGRCTTYQKDTKRSVQQYLNGKDYGKWIFYFSTGKIETKGKFNQYGKRTGKWVYYHENGEKKQISRYTKGGERSGKWVEFNKNGELINETNY